ncbi:MAG: hypothetical protein JWM50_2332 [Microbacteriaceae bacterium]|jgi:hypothetical protein|nr:hypothetical protein [Microbacteriaceae bacterium]
MTLVSPAPQSGASGARMPATRMSTPARPSTQRTSTARPRTRDGLARPKTGEVRVRVGALGLSSLGVQAAGLISAVGPEAGGFAPGDRVSYRTDLDRGATAEKQLSLVVPERDLIGFPKDVAVESAAAYLPLGLVARTVVKQLHSVGRGNRVAIAEDPSGAHHFVAAWVADLGATVVEPGDSSADVVISPSDYAAAARWRYANGLVQIAAADVFAEVRRGVFDDIAVTTYSFADADRARSEIARRESTTPVILLPEAA